jgi:hypothetical protein
LGEATPQLNSTFAIESFAEGLVMYRDRFVEFAALALLVVLVAAIYAGFLF